MRNVFCAADVAARHAPREASVLRQLAPTAFFSVTTASSRAASGASFCVVRNSRDQAQRHVSARNRMPAHVHIAAGMAARAAQMRRRVLGACCARTRALLRVAWRAFARRVRARTARDAMSTSPAAKPGAALRSQRSSCAEAASRAAPSVLLRLALSAPKMSSAAAAARTARARVSAAAASTRGARSGGGRALHGRAVLGIPRQAALRGAGAGAARQRRGTHPLAAPAARRARTDTWRAAQRASFPSKNATPTE